MSKFRAVVVLLVRGRLKKKKNYPYIICPHFLTHNLKERKNKVKFSSKLNLPMYFVYLTHIYIYIYIFFFFDKI